MGFCHIIGEVFYIGINIDITLLNELFKSLSATAKDGRSSVWDLVLGLWMDAFMPSSSSSPLAISVKESEKFE